MEGQTDREQTERQTDICTYNRWKIDSQIKQTGKKIDRQTNAGSLNYRRMEGQTDEEVEFKQTDRMTELVRQIYRQIGL